MEKGKTEIYRACVCMIRSIKLEIKQLHVEPHPNILTFTTYREASVWLCGHKQEAARMILITTRT